MRCPLGECVGFGPVALYPAGLCTVIWQSMTPRDPPLAICLYCNIFTVTAGPFFDQF
jgi:hypothetical protein